MRFSISLVILSLSLFSPVAFAEDITARSIMTTVDAREDGDRSTTDMEMILIDKGGSERRRTIASFSRDFGEDNYRLLFFTYPPDVKNTGFLTYDYDDTSRDDDQWLYLPALGKTKRIAAADKAGSFMGSDFSYSDMTRRNLDDYDFRLLKEGRVRDHAVWLIEAIPRTQKIFEETGYKKSILFVRQDNYVVVRALHFLLAGEKRKYMDVTGLELIDGIWTSTEITMKTVQGKTTLHRTIIRNRNVRYGVAEVTEGLFTTRRLEKGL